MSAASNEWAAVYARRYHTQRATLSHAVDTASRGTERDPAAPPRTDRGELALTYVGHATVLIDLDGTRLLTDPVLRYQVRALRRHAPDLHLGELDSLDAVLISHFHLDHLNPASLWLIPPETTFIVPEGGRKFLRRYGFRQVVEVSAGDAVQVGSVEVSATRAAHDGRRYPWGPEVEALGFLATGTRQVYFAGDTILFDEMAAISDHIDVALVPVWGWGRMTDDHLDPLDAARALQLLRPQMAVPIHWGTLLPQGVHLWKPELLTEPPRDFAAHAAEIAPEVEVNVLDPGATLRLEALR